MSRSPRAGLLLALAAQGCGLFSHTEPHAVQAEITPEAVTIPPIAYDIPLQYADFDVRNTGATTIFVTAATWLAETLENGSDGALTDAQVAGLIDFDLPPLSPVYPQQVRPLDVSIDPAAWRWVSGSYRVRLPFEIRYLWSGQEIDEPFDVARRAVPEPIAEVFHIEVAFSIDCDLDGDGFDAVACGGTDCNDDPAKGGVSAYPGAVEVCDGVDQDCDGAIDEDAEDVERFYLDADGDGYPDPDVFVDACRAPADGDWYRAPRNGQWDCDDEDPLVSPKEIETGGRCVDGVDNDCDGLVDEDDPACKT